MPLLYATIILVVLGVIALITGKIAKKNKIFISGIAVLSFVIIFWIGFYIWALYEADTEYERRLESDNIIQSEKITNSYNSNNVKNDVINEKNDIQDITLKATKGSFYQSGQIYKIDEDKIYFIDKDNNKYLYTKNDEIVYKDGRTGVKYNFDEIKEKYYIDFSINKTCLIFKNIEGEELKKELLISLSLPDEVNMARAGVYDIKEIKQLGNNEAIVTFVVGDLIVPEHYPNAKTQKFEIDVKFKNDTIYHSKGKYTYDASTIENSKDTIMLIRLNKETLDYQYPEVLKFDSSDT